MAEGEIMGFGLCVIIGDDPNKVDWKWIGGFKLGLWEQ